MQKIEVDIDEPEHKAGVIHIGSGAMDQINSLFDLGGYSKVFIVTDEITAPLLLEKLKSALGSEVSSVVLPVSENEKSLENVQKIWKAMHDAGCDRHSLGINLGGGVIGDIGGFAASTYMRGIDFLNVPTTLLSQVDSSIGGKTGFNFDGIKNLIGSFRQPIGVVIDPDTLNTLPDREFVSGFGEIIKHGLVWDKSHFEKATAKQPRQFTEEELSDIIADSCRIKLAIVQSDIHESGNRRLVNFGHTVGHAIEALSLDTDKPLLHGEAVSIGMVAEAIISTAESTLQAEDTERIKAALANAGLPVSITGLKVDDILAKMQSDKKNSGGKVNFTLLDGIGHAAHTRQVPQGVVTEAIQAILD